MAACGYATVADSTARGVPEAPRDLYARPADGRSRYGIRLSSGEVGRGFMLLLFEPRVEALLFAAERPGLVQQLAGGGAARLCWPFSLSAVIF